MNASPPDQSPDRGRAMPLNPSDAYPPTRPGAMIIVIAAALIAIGLGIENWPDLSALAKSAGL